MLCVRLCLYVIVCDFLWVCRVSVSVCVCACVCVSVCVFVVRYFFASLRMIWQRFVCMCACVGVCVCMCVCCCVAICL